MQCAENEAAIHPSHNLEYGHGHGHGHGRTRKSRVTYLTSRSGPSPMEEKVVMLQVATVWRDGMMRHHGRGAKTG